MGIRTLKMKYDLFDNGDGAVDLEVGGGAIIMEERCILAPRRRRRQEGDEDEEPGPEDNSDDSLSERCTRTASKPRLSTGLALAPLSLSPLFSAVSTDGDDATASVVASSQTAASILYGKKGLDLCVFLSVLLAVSATHERVDAANLHLFPREQSYVLRV